MSIACPELIGSYPSLCVAVDNYCERTSAALTAEPVNALTNAAFLVAAWAAWRLHREHPELAHSGLVRALIATIAIVGCGSFLFHTVGARWAEWGDVLPIMLFMLLYLWLAMTVFFGWPAWLKLLGLLIYFFATFSIETAVPATMLWGGALYLPSLAVMLAISGALYWLRSAAAPYFALATGVFLLSFTARTLDAPVCSAFPLGTHFLWHLLNPILLYLLVAAAIGAAPSDQRKFLRVSEAGGRP